MFDENEIHHEMYLHFLSSTKNQQPVIIPSIAQYLYSYMCDLALTCDSHVIGGKVFSDHFQLVLKFSPDFSLDDLMKTIKVGTALWIRTNCSEIKDFEWQKSDFAFSVGFDEVIDILDKFKKPKPFIDELYPILDANGLKYDPKGVLE